MTSRAELRKSAVCACVTDHRPDPLVLHRHHIHPEADGGPSTDDNLVWVCPTLHDSVHALLRIMRRLDGAFTYREATRMFVRPVNRYAYALARLGWLRLQVAGAAK